MVPNKQQKIINLVRIIISSKLRIKYGILYDSHCKKNIIVGVDRIAYIVLRKYRVIILSK
jgi:hypothetical protein